MVDDTKRLVQAQFDSTSESYYSSVTHAQGDSLDRLIALTNPQADWWVLDIATGAGHTAARFAPATRVVIASDLTFSMLRTSRRYHPSLQHCQHAACDIPFSDGVFDLVTCRIAPHHFPDVAKFVLEAARVLKPGGLVAVADNVVTGESDISQYVNAFEKLRDLSHQRMYSMDDWRTFAYSAGLNLVHMEVIEKEMPLEDWMERMQVTHVNRERLRTMLWQAPAAARSWLRPQTKDGLVTFLIREGIIIARKGTS